MEIVLNAKNYESKPIYVDLVSAILDNNFISIFAKDLDFKYFLINQYASLMFQKIKGEMIGKTDGELFPVAFAEQSLLSDRLVLEKKGIIKEEYKLECKEGICFFSIMKSPLYSKEGEICGIFCVAIDITPQKQAQNKLNDYLEKLELVTTELMEARLAAEQASKAKTAFLTNMSHELRTPLNGIMGNVTLLLHTELTSKQENYINRIQSSSQLLLEIIGSVLDLSKITAGEMKLEAVECDITQIAKETYNILISKAEEKKLEFKCTLPDKPIPLILSDPVRLKQVLVNLLNNAIKFTEKGSVNLLIRIISHSNEGILLDFEISDTGIGISEEKMLHLFERFWQADLSTTRKYGGTGLGLAIAKEIITLMGGKISAKSQVGTGTVFKVEIPFFIAHQKDINKI